METGIFLRSANSYNIIGKALILSFISPEEQRYGSGACMASDGGTDGEYLYLSVQLLKLFLHKRCHCICILPAQGMAQKAFAFCALGFDYNCTIWHA